MRRQGDSLRCPRSLLTAGARWHLPPPQAPGVGSNLQHRIVGRMHPGRGSAGDGAAVVLITLVQACRGVSLAAGARGLGGGVASAAILRLGWWSLLANGYAIVFGLQFEQLYEVDV